MKLTIQLKLLPTPTQAEALKQTLLAANAACNQISHVAWHTKTFRQFALHKLAYRSVRETFGLAAQLVVRCLAKVAQAYKLDRKTPRQFARLGAIPYDARILSFALADSSISLWTCAGRLSIRFACGKRQRELLPFQKGESDLAFVRGHWYLLATIEVAEAQPFEPEGVLGVDLGIINLATDSDGAMFGGSQVEQVRQWYVRRRRALQKVGTKSAKRRLRQLAGRQRRFQKDTNHRVSKQLVAKAERTKRAIALEDLSGIRQRARVRGPGQRARHSNWAFGQMRAFVEYKAQQAGVPVVVVEAAYTSQRCSRCGHTCRANRKNQAEFCCVACSHTLPADLNAAITIEWAAVNRPLVSNSCSVHRVEAQAQLL
jgi:IS605 OrfB family transposase